MPAFHARSGMPYWIELVSRAPKDSEAFYADVLKWQYQGDSYRIARASGFPVAGIAPQPDSHANSADMWLTCFLAQDLDAQLKRVPTLGGQVLSPATPVQLGVVAIIADPSGAILGLIDPAGEDSFIAAGEPGTMVWHELAVTRNYAQCEDFYRELFGWTIAQAEGYSHALIDGSAFAGIRHSEAESDIPGYWLPFLGVVDADAAVRTLEKHGGEVGQGPVDTEFGRLALVRDLTGAVVMLCETPEPPEEENMSESEDLLGFMEDLPGGSR